MFKSLNFHLGNLSRYTTNDAEMVSTLLAVWLIHTTLGSAGSSLLTAKPSLGPLPNNPPAQDGTS